MGKSRLAKLFPGDSKHETSFTGSVKTNLLFKKAVVIGAGCSGIQAAIQLQQAGCEVRILEQGPNYGGSFLTCSPSAELQCPWEEFCFPDFDWPDHIRPSSPSVSATADQVRAYIQAYATHHGLRKRTYFNCRDVKVTFQGCTEAGVKQKDDNQKWKVHYRLPNKTDRLSRTAALVVIATGLHSNPVVPTLENQHHFFGQQVHARDILHTANGKKLLEGKAVIMFGSGHGINETLAECLAADHAESVSYVNRQVQWPVTRTKLPGALHADSKSLAGLRAQPYYTESEGIIGCTPGLNPFKPFKLVNARKELEKAYNMSKVQAKPYQPLDTALVHGPQYVWHKDQWAAALQRKQTDGYRSEVYTTRAKKMHCNGVILETNELAPADVVVYCTGYAQDYSSLLEASLLEKMELQPDGLYLYRSVVHPRFPSLAFIGCAADTHNTRHTAALQSKWLVSLWSLEMPSPHPHTMYNDIHAQCMWRRKNLPAAMDRSAQYGAYMADYWKQLQKDINSARPIPLPQHIDDAEIKKLQHEQRQYSTDSIATSAGSSRNTAPIPAVWPAEGSRTGQTSVSGAAEQPSPITSAGGLLNAVKGIFTRKNIRSSPGTPGSDLSPAPRHGSCIQANPRKKHKDGSIQQSSKSFTAGITPSPRPPRPSRSRLSTATQSNADKNGSPTSDVAKTGATDVANSGNSPSPVQNKHNRAPSAQISRTSLARTATLQAGLQAHQHNVSMGLAQDVTTYQPAEPLTPLPQQHASTTLVTDHHDVHPQVGVAAPKHTITTCRLATMTALPERSSPRKPSGLIPAALPAHDTHNTHSTHSGSTAGHALPERSSPRKPSGLIPAQDTHNTRNASTGGRALPERKSPRMPSGSVPGIDAHNVTTSTAGRPLPEGNSPRRPSGLVPGGDTHNVTTSTAGRPLPEPRRPSGLVPSIDIHNLTTYIGGGALPEGTTRRRPSNPVLGYDAHNAVAYTGGQAVYERSSQRPPSGVVPGFDMHDNVAYMAGRRMSTRSSASVSSPEITAISSRDPSRTSRASRTSCPPSPTMRTSRASSLKLADVQQCLQAATSRQSLGSLNASGMDATSAGLLRVVEENAKSGFLPRTYTERSYATLLRNSAVGLEPQGF